MEITYTVTPDDAWRYNKFVVSRVPAWRLQYLSRFLSVPLGVFVGLYTSNASLELRLLGSLLALFIWIPFCLWSAKRHNLKVINNRPGVIGPRTLAIKPDAIYQKSPYTESATQWSAISDIDSNRDVVCLFMDKRYAFAVPRRAFAMPNDADRFLSTAQVYWNAAKNGTPLPAEVPADESVWPPAPRTL